MGADEFTPREFGLMAGNRWASGLGADDENVRRAADGEVSSETREFVMQRGQMKTTLETYGEDEFSEGFWDGFIHGVRAFIGEERSKRLADQN